MKKQWAAAICVASILVVLGAAFAFYPPLSAGTSQQVLPYFVMENEDKININTAPAAELCALPGIGEAKAAAIVVYRELNGGFAALEELLKVNGIGPAVFERIEQLITL